MSSDAESTPGELLPGNLGNDIVQQLQSDSAVGADSAGAPLSVLSPISETLPDAESSLGETLSPLKDLITCAELDVEATAAKLAAKAAAASAELAASKAAGSPNPQPPSAASALKKQERVQLKLSRPLMQVP
jgi:hypothetical protein